MAEQTRHTSEGHTGPQPGDEEVDLYYHHLDAFETKFLGGSGVASEIDKPAEQESLPDQVAFGD
jgi:hypothetical protein